METTFLQFFHHPEEFLFAEFFLFRFPQKNTEFISSNAVTVSITAIGFFQASGNFPQAPVSSQMAVRIVDVLKIVQIQHNQHPVLRTQIQSPV